MGESGREDPTTGLEARRDALGGFSDWAAAMQVYYKTGPHPPLHGYYPGHVAPPPYVWGPQPVMPPYGAPPHPYFHGGVYHHPAMPGHAPPPPPPPPPAYGYGVPAAMVDLAVVRPKSAESGEGGATTAVLMHPVGVAVAPANTVTRPAIGLENGSDGSSGSDAVDVMERKRKFEVMMPDPMISRMDHVAIAPAKDGLPCSAVTTTSSESTRLAAGLASSTLDEREAKRQRRKQSNRESARRSRLRKQAECEDLGTRVSTLTMENMRLRSEISKARENYNQLAEEQALLQQQIHAATNSAADVSFGVSTSSRGKPSPCREVDGKSRRGMQLVHIKDNAADNSAPVTLVLDDDATEGGALVRRDREGLVTRTLWGKSDVVKKTLSLVAGMERDSGAKSVKIEPATNVLGSSSSPWNRQQRSKLEESVVATVA
ncbi:hypothetical protein CBR_g30825 [Chara braunii]|uniref:BZIP domain-containing protein n=1 Tax=Chara braunii TaxID=69332 RepID=A0A388JXK8_CHABU|nr:hypothetical protein CBR_g30825 [Chara braunii]|eukprot:GBG62507.1 hypothetical protein CBR_g30825 [Chara braunii]